MKIFAFQKPDMDTVLTAIILGFDFSDQLIISTPEISQELLERPDIYCIECGGSGQLESRNFDHHNTQQLLPSACAQAYSWKGLNDSRLFELVNYVKWVDEGLIIPGCDKQVGFYVSNVYSGMLFMYADSIVDQFYHGALFLKKIIEKKINPWKPVPKISEWQPYVQLKKRQWFQLEKYKSNINFYKTDSGLTFGFLCAPVPGIHALLRRSGCKISIAAGLTNHNEKMYMTISSNQLSMLDLLPEINKREKGWGGPCHGKIIGSPKKGTIMSETNIVDIIIKQF